MKAGPKAAVDSSPPPFRSRLGGVQRFAAFCRQYVVVPKGKGSPKPLQLRDWRTELVGSVLDQVPPPSPMPSRPLSADNSRRSWSCTPRLDVEAIDLAKHRTEMPAAVARLV